MATVKEQDAVPAIGYAEQAKPWEVGDARANYKRILIAYGWELKPNLTELFLASGLQQYVHRAFQRKIPTVNPKGKIRVKIEAITPIDDNNIVVSIGDRRFNLPSSFYLATTELTTTDCEALQTLYRSVRSKVRPVGPHKNPPFDLSLLQSDHK